MKQIMSVLVENKAGVLSRTAGLFARRGFNIESLAVGETEDVTISRMTIVVNGDERTIEQVEKQLNKQIDVIKVKTLEVDTATRRELLLIKIYAQQQKRGEIIDICSIMNAKIVDMSHTTLTIEMCDRPERVALMMNCVLDRLDQEWIPVEKNWRLNEKHYGVLQGLNKSETDVYKRQS